VRVLFDVRRVKVIPTSYLDVSGTSVYNILMQVMVCEQCISCPALIMFLKLDGELKHSQIEVLVIQLLSYSIYQKT
jgi:hypothetical protein